MLIHKYLTSFGKYLILMGRSFARPERMRMFMKQYVKEMSGLDVEFHLYADHGSYEE